MGAASSESKSHYSGVSIENGDKENGEDSKEHREKGEREKRDKERQGQETAEQSISLLYTPCLF